MHCAIVNNEGTTYDENTFLSLIEF